MTKIIFSIIDRYQEENINENLPVDKTIELTEKIQPEQNPEKIENPNFQEELERRPLVPGSIKEIFNMKTLSKHAFLPFSFPKGSPPTNITDIISKFVLFTFLLTTVGFGKNFHFGSVQ